MCYAMHKMASRLVGSGSQDKGLAAADCFRNAVNNCNVPQEWMEQKWNVCVW